MSEYPPVSIYIITFLDSEERCRLLRSVCLNALSQRYPDFEVVVADNAGPIAAERALKSISDSRLKIFRNDENLGFTGNINRCTEYCEYEIIKLLCDDDMLHYDCLTHSVPFVDDDTCVVVGYKRYLVGTEPKDIGDELSDPPVMERRLAGYGKSFWKFPYISLPGCTLFTKNLFRSIGGYDGLSPLSDLDFLVEVRFRANVVHLHLDLCYMGIWEGSVTQEMLQTSPYFFDTGKLYTMFRFLKCSPLSAAERTDLVVRLFVHLFWQSMRIPKHLFEKKYWVGYREYLHCFIGGMVKSPKFYQMRCAVQTQKASIS